MRLRVQRLGDPMLRERAHDFDDLARRLLRHLTGDERSAATACRATPFWWRAPWGRPNFSIMAATSCWAWCWRTRPPPSHVAIVARSMGLPLVGSLEGIADTARAGDAIVVDGETGEVHLRPHAEIVTAFEAKRALRAQAQARFAAVRDLPAVTGTACTSS